LQGDLNKSADHRNYFVDDHRKQCDNRCNNNGVTEMTTLAEIANVLKTTEANALNRVVKMKLAVRYCGRCGGSGSYSFNGSHSRCYDCNGAGYPKPVASDFPAILDNARAAAADGRLDTYLRYVEASKIVGTATKTVLNAWAATEVAKVNNGVSHMIRDEELPNLPELRRRNKAMHDAYQTVEALSRKLNSKAATYQADCIALAEAVTAALATIAEMDDYAIPSNLVEYSNDQKAKREANRAARFGW
jgi:hypothetical protein